MELNFKSCFCIKLALEALLKPSDLLAPSEKNDSIPFLMEHEDTKHKMTSIPIDKDLAILFLGRSKICLSNLFIKPKSSVFYLLSKKCRI